MRGFGLLLIAGFASSAGGPLSAADKIDFQREIRPLLADKCFACHGRDAEHRQGGLRLDERGAALGSGDSGEQAIVPGMPGKSELVRRIFSTDADEQMPPPKAKKSLTAAEKELLKRWIAEGAEYKDHWAFSPPVKPAMPAVRNTAWPKNEIDRFILAKLEQEKLSPSPPADPLTLLRRVSLDLVGLPPTLAELDEFVAPSLPPSVAPSPSGEGTARPSGGGKY
jgi:hypothetical protein